MMSCGKLKFSDLRWVALLIVSIVINIQITLLVIHHYGNHVNQSLTNSNLISNIVGKMPYQEQSVPVHIKIPAIPIETNQSTILPTVLTNLASNQRISDILTHVPSLPRFTDDGRDFVFSAVIERSFDAYGPYITTFFLAHHMLEAFLLHGVGAERASDEMRSKWKEAVKKFQSLKYEPSGERSKQIKYTCKISNSLGDVSYYVDGRFLPNRLSSDVNANRRMDILRCPLHDFLNASNSLKYSNHEVQVEIFSNTVTLTKFSIPWKTRRTGYLLHSVPAASNIDAWAESKAASEQSEFTPTIHLNMPGSRLLPSKKNFALMLEYVSHHLLIGFDHIYFTIALPWKSEEMKHLLQLMRSYIDEGKLSIVSSSGDATLSVTSSHGLQWHSLALKTFQSSMILYFAKGFADYVALLDVDEFFIPKAHYQSITQLIRDIDYHPLHIPSFGSPGEKGFADVHSHPFCFITLRSEIVARTEHESANPSPWLGKRFSHASERNEQGSKTSKFSYLKAIYPTRKVYQSGTDVVESESIFRSYLDLSGVGSAGACRLDWQWTSCLTKRQQEFCEKGFDKADSVKIHTTHRFDEMVDSANDVKSVNPKTQGVVYHYMVYHTEMVASISSLMNASEYSKKYFPAVMLDLKKRELDYLLAIPDSPTQPYGMVPNTWNKLFTKDEIKESLSNQPPERTVGIVPPGMTIDSFPPLPKSFSNRQSQIEVDLPDFTIDYTDFVLSSMIERESGSYNLYLTTFFLCHMLLEPQVGASAATAEYIHPAVVNVWKKAMRVSKSTKYTENGEREQPPRWFCKITHSESSSSYYAKGRFVPNRLTPDSNSNRRLDILRCPMQYTKDIYENLDQLKKGNLVVEIFKGTEMMIKFRIPWSTRMTGYMLSSPTPIDFNSSESNIPVVTTFDAWKGVDLSKPAELWSHDRLYMCVPGLESAPDKITLPLYLEFIEHHLQMGVDRIFIVASLGWRGKNMKLLLRVLNSYIIDDKVSVQSSSFDGYDYIYTTGGLQWGRDNVKNFYVNMCTYFSKGVADYVAVWDFDELFTPLGKYKSITDLIDDVDVPPTAPIPYFHAEDVKESELRKTWKGGKGLADGDGHPLCFIVMSSLVTLREKAWQHEWDYTRPWIGQRFSHGQENSNRDGKGLAFYKTIRPTRVTFQGGLHHTGACRLPAAWDGCTSDPESRPFGVCYGETGESTRLSQDQDGFYSFHLNQLFDEVVSAEDAKTVSIADAYINHIQFHRLHFGASDDALARKSVYGSQYFGKVIEAIDRKDLELPISLPEKSLYFDPNEKPTLSAADGWIPGDFLFQPQPPSTNEDLSQSEGEVTVCETLPCLSHDSSELALAGILDGGFVTVHFLSHTILSHETSSRSHDHLVSVHRSAIKKWKLFMTPDSRSTRRFSKFKCILQNSPDDQPYEVDGEWFEIPVDAQKQLTQAVVDIMRCPIHVPEDASVLDVYRNNISKNRVIRIQIMRGNIKLFSFSIPWLTRVTSEYFSPISTRSSVSNYSYDSTTSKFLAWKGILDIPSQPSTMTRQRDKLHLCLSGYLYTPSRESAGALLEFIMHNILLGVEHTFLSVGFSKSSDHVMRLERMLRPFIAEGKLTIFSHSHLNRPEYGDTDLNLVYGVDGLVWSADIAVAIQNELCAAYSRGVADYLMISDVDTFMIPAVTSTTNSVYPLIKDILELAEVRGWFKCSKDIVGAHSSENPDDFIIAGVTRKHPCRFELMHHVVFTYSDDAVEEETKSAWLGDRYKREPEGKAFSIFKGDKNKIFRLSMSPDDVMNAADQGKGLPLSSLHFDRAKVDELDRNRKRLELGLNAYHRKYHPVVRSQLQKRNLDLFIDIPLRIKTPITANKFWLSYFKVWDEREK